MSAIIEKLFGQRPRVDAATTTTFEEYPEYFHIDPAENPMEARQEVEDMLANTEGLSDAQFVEFTEKMIHLVGGYGHKINNGRTLMMAAEIGKTLSGNSVELRRYQGEWTGPDAYCIRRRATSGKIGKEFPVVLEEMVTVFSYDPEFDSRVTRKVETPIPALIPQAESVTGEKIKLFEPVDLKGSFRLDGEALRSVASNAYEFYKSIQGPSSDDVS